MCVSFFFVVGIAFGTLVGRVCICCQSVAFVRCLRALRTPTFVWLCASKKVTAASETSTRYGRVCAGEGRMTCSIRLSPRVSSGDDIDVQLMVKVVCFWGARR